MAWHQHTGLSLDQVDALFSEEEIADGEAMFAMQAELREQAREAARADAQRRSGNAVMGG